MSCTVLLDASCGHGELVSGLIYSGPRGLWPRGGSAFSINLLRREVSMGPGCHPPGQSSFPTPASPTYDGCSWCPSPWSSRGPAGWSHLRARDLERGKLTGPAEQKGAR